MFRQKSVLGIALTLLVCSQWATAEEFGVQAVTYEGQAVTSQATFSGGFSVENEELRGDGNVDAAKPVKITGQIQVDPTHVGQSADLVVYVHYSELSNPASTALMLTEEGRKILPWNSDVASLQPFAKVTLQASHSLEIYNGLLPESKIKVYFGYLLSDGTLITNKLPIDLAVETISTTSNTEAEVAEEAAARIDTTPLLTAGEDDGRLVGTTACKWNDGQTVKVGFDFTGANFNYVPSGCYSGMARSVCENTVADAVMKTIATWSQYGNIYFRKSAWNESDIRIQFQEKGSYSYIGKCKPATNETMNLAFSFLRSATDFRGTVLHESGHAIGLQHEHNSPNVAYTWNESQIIKELSSPPNSWDVAAIRHNVLDSLLKGAPRSAFYVTQFDPQSIMIYSIPKTWVAAADLANPQKCPDAASSPHYCVAPKTDLSAIDKQGIAGFYPQRSLSSGCSYTYNPASYRQGTSLWDGHIGNIAFNNPTTSTVKVTLYHPDAPSWAFSSWNIPARVNGTLYYNSKPVVIGMDWGIQVNDSPICIVKVASNWVSNYFQASTTKMPGM